MRNDHFSPCHVLICVSAWLLNLRGDDIPFNPVFHSYLFVSLSQAVLFIEPSKVAPAVDDYLNTIGVERQEYNEVWSFLRLKPWGEGKVCAAQSQQLPKLTGGLRIGYHHSSDFLRHLADLDEYAVHRAAFVC